MTQIKMADNEYFALDRLSFSSLKYILDSPVKYLYKKQFPFEGNDATELGTAIHLWLQGEKRNIFFEPDLSRIKTKEGIIAKNPRMTNEGKAIIEEFRASLPKGVIAVSYETKALLEQVEMQFKSNADIQVLMSHVNNVEGAYLTEIEGLKFKGKLDFEGVKQHPGDVQNRQHFIIDLKSTGKSASVYIDDLGVAHGSFINTINDSHYDLQAAIYLTMKAEQLKCNIFEIPYHIIAIETFAPYEVFSYKLSEKRIQKGLSKLKKACDLFKTYVIEKNPYYRKTIEI